MLVIPFSIVNADFLSYFSISLHLANKEKRGPQPSPVLPFYLPQISSKVSVTAFSGAGVASDTITIAMHAARNAGSSS
jgi:hypothetical protein